MKNKEEIKQEIYKLAKKFSETNSEDALLELARELHEKSILLKHTDNIFQTSPEIESTKEEKIIIEEKSIKPEPPKKEILSKESSIDLFSSESISAEVSHEAISEKPLQKETKASKKKSEEESVGEKLFNKKITNLKASIGINEKFQFINELFEGNMKEYNVAVDQINNFSEYADAEKYIADLKDMYKWNENEENPIAKNFIDLVQRRFV